MDVDTLVDRESTDLLIDHHHANLFFHFLKGYSVALGLFLFDKEVSQARLADASVAKNDYLERLVFRHYLVVSDYGIGLDTKFGSQRNLGLLEAL